jgi:hypothetical protein
VHRLKRDDLHDQQVHGALDKIGRFAHRVTPYDGRQESSRSLVDSQGDWGTLTLGNLVIW